MHFVYQNCHFSGWAYKHNEKRMAEYKMRKQAKCYSKQLLIYTLSGRTGSALVWHSEGRTIEALSVQQVL